MEIILNILFAFTVIWVILLMFSFVLSCQGYYTDTESFELFRQNLLGPLYILYWTPILFCFSIYYLTKWFWKGLKEIPKAFD